MKVWIVDLFIFFVTSEAVHARDHGSGRSHGGGGSRRGERVESEPGGPERGHVREVRAPDQLWRYDKQNMMSCFVSSERHGDLWSSISLRVPAESECRYARWKKAVQKSMNWETTEPVSSGNGEHHPPRLALSHNPVRFSRRVIVGNAQWQMLKKSLTLAMYHQGFLCLYINVRL